MKPLVINKDNAYFTCRHCSGIELCRGTDAFATCSTWCWKKRDNMKGRKHPDICIFANNSTELFMVCNLY